LSFNGSGVSNLAGGVGQLVQGSKPTH
jgi:X-X-X-Leu-X-X-Gly heptad repeat protein